MWETLFPSFEDTQITHTQNYTGIYTCTRTIFIMMYGYCSFKSYLFSCIFVSGFSMCKWNSVYMETSKWVMSFNSENTEYNTVCIYRDKIIYTLLNAVSNMNDISTICFHSVIRHLRKTKVILNTKMMKSILSQMLSHKLIHVLIDQLQTAQQVTE